MSDIKEKIISTLKENKWSAVKTASILGIARSHVYYHASKEISEYRSIRRAENAIKEEQKSIRRAHREENIVSKEDAKLANHLNKKLREIAAHRYKTSYQIIKEVYEVLDV